MCVVVASCGSRKPASCSTVWDQVWCGFQTAGSVVEPAILQRSDDRLYGLHIRDTPSFLSSSVDRLYQELELVTPLSVFVLSVARPLGSP
jgi:hypothetical protein